MLRHRLILGTLLIALVVGVCFADQWIEGTPLPSGLRPLLMGQTTAPPGVAVFVLAAALCILAARELAAIMRANGIEASKRITTLAAVVGLLVSSIVPAGFSAATAAAVVCSAAVAILLVSLAFHSRRRSVEGVVASAGGTLLAFVYLGIMFGFVLAIRREHSVWVLGWLVMTTKSCDIGAYFTGRLIGRHKLILWLSPGKTWEGLVGGVLTSAAVGAGGLALLRGTEPGLPAAWTGAIGGAVLGLTGQLGDLVESLFKRDAGMKDSSKILPGFGGVLDVLDSPLMALPVAFWWLHTIRT